VCQVARLSDRSTSAAGAVRGQQFVPTEKYQKDLCLWCSVDLEPTGSNSVQTVCSAAVVGSIQ
jgi:hypothetical protein